ncbi:MAG: hypothetical protein J6P05_05030 [Lachnospiraceae bacterium]|nr:hypothetical protein [Lachnospiraceae bacterium]
MKTLKLKGGDGLYTNLGLLLSEQCGHTIKAAVFQGTDKEVFNTFFWIITTRLKLVLMDSGGWTAGIARKVR